MTQGSRSCILAVVCLLSFVGSSWGQEFAVGQTFSAPTHPNSAAVADFNGDQWPDLAIPSYSPNSLAIYLGDGTGRFLPPTVYAAGSGPRFAAVSDLNADGLLDVIVANQDSRDVSVLLATGPGTFAPQRRFSAGLAPRHVTAARLNGDAFPDLLVSNEGEASVSVLFGDGTGSFLPATKIVTGTTPRSTVVGDFNEDGAADVAVANGGADDVWIFVGDGSGNLNFFGAFQCGQKPFTIATGNLNGDAHLDLVVPNFEGTTATVLFGTGLGSFLPGITLPAGASPHSVTIAEFDGNGAADLAVSNRDGNTVTILLGTGGGAFTRVGEFGVGSGTFHAVPADVDRDGHLDLVSADRDGGTVTVLHGLGDGHFIAPRAFSAGLSPRGVAAGDVNADGKPDVVTANTNSNTVSVLLGAGAGTLGSAQHLAVRTSPYSPLLADFTGDGVADIAVANGGANNVSVLRGFGDGQFAPAVHSSGGSTPRSIAAGDVNEDGKLDLVVANYTPGTISVLTGKGNGTFNTPLAVVAGANPSSVILSDLNGDGELDAAVTNATTSQVRVLFGNGAGGFGTPTVVSVGAGPAALAAADVNGDGWLDLAVANETANSVSIVLGQGAGVFTPLLSLAVGSHPLAIVAGDLNADGFVDVATANSTSNTITVLRGRGDGTFENPIQLVGGVTARALALGDFDGDARPDIVVGNAGSNDVWVVLNRMGAAADLSISLDNAANGVVNGASVSYAITVSNAGPASLTAVNLTLTVPAGLVSPVFTPSSGSFDPETGVWSGLDLASGSSVAATLSGTVSASATGTLTVSGSVAAPMGAIDPVGSNNNATDVDAIVRGSTDLQISLTNGRSTLEPGEAAIYALTVTNAGATDVPSAAVQFTVPADLSLGAWQCVAASGASCPAAGSGAIPETVVLPAGSSVTLTINAVVVNRPAGLAVTVSASVAPPADIRDTNAANDTALDSDTLDLGAPPVPLPQSVTVQEDGSVEILLSATDADGDSLTFSVETAPAHGTLSGTAPQLTYTPTPGYSGPDSFTFRADDGIRSAIATVSIDVVGVNDAPVASSASVSTDEDQPKAVTLVASDADADALTYTIVSAPAHGVLGGTAPNLTYTPTANFNGSDSFSFRVSDGQLQSTVATVAITIAAVNDVPVVLMPLSDVSITGEETSLSLSVANVFADVETAASALVLTVTSSDAVLLQPSLSGSTLHLELAANRSGSAVVTVRATDAGGAWKEDSFTVSVLRPGVHLAISDASRAEGSGTGLVFTLSLLGSPSVPVSVRYTTANGTAIAGLDYGSASGIVTFSPGVTSRTVTISTIGDTIDEEDETMQLLLSEPVGLLLDDASAVGTIVDNDTSSLSFLDVSVTEGNTGITAATFTVTLSTPNSREVSVNFATADLSGLAARDYMAKSGTLTFPAGSTAAQTVTIDVLGDLLDENNEAFSFLLSGAVNSAIGRASGRANIVDDDDPPSVSVSSPSVVEGNSGSRSLVFTLTLSRPSELRTRVRYQTADGTALAGSDYTARSGEISFDAGVTSKTVAVAVAGDTIVEPTETMFLDLHTPTSLTIAVPRGTGTIVTDDGGV